MRRSDREVTGQENLVAIFAKCDVCRLALNGADGWPYILPLNFGEEYKDGELVLYFHGAGEGTKFELMQRDNRASFEADCSHELFIKGDASTCSMAYESVIGQGVLELVPEEEKLHALEVLMAHYHREDLPINLAVAARTAVFKLTVQRMTGKRRQRT